MNTCITCKKEIEKPTDNFTTGYGIDKDNNKVCYACCAEVDKEQMRTTGQIMLYLSKHKLTNWPGTLVIPVNFIRTGKHNIARVRYDVWFTFEGMQWHGVQYGDMTQICHCKRLKNQNTNYSGVFVATLREEEMKTIKYDVWSLDVWGNEKDGFEINDRSCFKRGVEFPTTHKVYNEWTQHEFSDDWPTDQQIIDTLIEIGLLKNHMTLADVTIGGECESTLYIDDSKNGFPICQLVNVEGG